MVNDEGEALELYKKTIDDTYKAYNKLIKKGVAREQARALLPVSFYTEWYWTASLQTISHFVNLRDHAGAQLEIREFALEIDIMMNKILPNTWKALRN